MVSQAFLRPPMPATSLPRRPVTPVRTAIIAAVGMAPVTAPVNMKRSSAGAAGDDVKLRIAPGEAKNWTNATDDAMMQSIYSSSEE
jgi:hypothetical protein